MFHKILFFDKRGGGNDIPSSLFSRQLLFAALLVLTAFPVIAQLPAYPILSCSSTNPAPLRIEIEPISTPICGEDECNRQYFQVRLATNNSFPGNPVSFLMSYEKLSMTIKMVTDPVGGLSIINETVTEQCSPSGFGDFFVDVELDNQVTLLLEGVCDPIDGPEVVFTRTGSGPPYLADLFVIAVDGVQGEDLLFELIQAQYTCPDYSVYCYDAIPLQSDEFTVPSLIPTEPNICIEFDDYDYDTDLLPVMAYNNSTSGSIEAEYLSFTAVIETDYIMDIPRLLNPVIPFTDYSVVQIPSTNNWRVFVRFNASSGITVPSLGTIKLFDIEIKGPENESLDATVEVCLIQGEMRREGSTSCRNACFTSPGCVEIEFDGHQPCDPNNFTVVVTKEEAGITCEELEVRVQLNWATYFSALDFDQIRIAVEFDLAPGVTIDDIGTSTFGCPSSNTSCDPEGGFDNCFKIDGNRVTFCFFPITPEEVLLGSYFTVLFDAPSNCVNGAIVREAMVDVSTDPPGGSECVTNVYVEDDDFPLCSPLLAGWVKNANGEHIDDVNVAISRKVSMMGCLTEEIEPNNDPWSWCPCDVSTYRILPEVLNDDNAAWLNGVTSYDLTLIGRHVQNINDRFTSVYQFAAADANGNSEIDEPIGIIQTDIVEFRKLILGIYSKLPANNSWRYFEDGVPGTTPSAMFPSDQFTLPPQFIDAYPSDPDINFIAVKIGDVNNSHNTDIELRPAGTLPLLTEAMPRMAVGEYISIPVRYNGEIPLTALQMGLRFDADVWEYVGMTTSDVPQVSEDCFNLNHTADGKIKFVWFCIHPDDYIRPGQAMFFLTFRAKRAVRGDQNPILVDDGLLRSVAYAQQGTIYNLSLGAEAIQRDIDMPSSHVLDVSCSPNPTSGAVNLAISTTSEAATATVWAYSATGQRLLRRVIPLTGTSTNFQFPESASWPAGLYVWKVKVGNEKTEGRLIKQ